MAELFGRTTGYSGGKGGSMHIADIELGNLGANGIVGAGIPIAAGAALGSKIRKDGKVTVAFFGDGAGPTGAFHEGVNVAATMNLPAVFVCENNQYGMATHADFANAGPIELRGPAYGIPSASIDGNDIFEVYAHAKAAVDRARRGEGPTLIESRTYRHKGHTVLDQKNYRTKEEIAEWVARDPIERFLKTVNEAERLDEDEVQAIDAQIEREVEHAVAFAEASPWPNVDVIERDVYVE
jgi:pyruvate dehydrogenase E1 component alpha subunit